MLYQRIYDQLLSSSHEAQDRMNVRQFKAFREFFDTGLSSKSSTSGPPPFFYGKLILFLDELDRFVDSQTSVRALAELFRWALAPTSCLLVVANTNDLEILDRLQILSTSIIPQIVFRPYTFTQLSVILQRQVDLSQFQIEAQALEYCARKMASTSGDARKALDTLGAVMQQLLIEDDPNSRVKKKKKKITLEHMHRVMHDSTWTSCHKIRDQIQELPRGAKLVLVGLHRAASSKQNHSKQKLTSVSMIEDFLAQQRRRHAWVCSFTPAQVNDMICRLEQSALIQVKKKNSSSFRQWQMTIQSHAALVMPAIVAQDPLMKSLE